MSKTDKKKGYVLDDSIFTDPVKFLEDLFRKKPQKPPEPPKPEDKNKHGNS